MFFLLLYTLLIKLKKKKMRTFSVPLRNVSLGIHQFIVNRHLQVMNWRLWWLFWKVALKKKSNWTSCKKNFFSIKINDSQYIALFMVRRPIKKLFWIDYVNTHLFSIFFKYILPSGKVWGYPTLLILWFVNFKRYLLIFLQ